MNTETIQKFGLAAAALTALAGLAELIAGSTSWTGDKSEPTTLGLLTIGLAVVMAIAARELTRRQSTGELLVVAAGLAIPAMISLTTAGLAAIPGAVVGVIAAALIVRQASERGSIRQVVSNDWPMLLVGVLAVIYLAFGAASGGVGLLGIFGAAAMFAAFVIGRTSVIAGAVVLIIGVAPFAVMAWWSVVIPLTALLIVAIGVPQLRRLAGTDRPMLDAMPAGT